MIISIDAQMAFDRIQYPLWSQRPEDARDRGNTPQHKKAICYEPIANIMQMKKKLKQFHKIRARLLLWWSCGFWLHISLCNELHFSAVNLSWNDKARERNNFQLEKGVKLPLFADSMIQIIRDPKHATENI